MAETVNEPTIFEEADFADAQTPEQPGTPVEEVKEQPTSQESTIESADESTANESQPTDDIDKFLANKGISKDDPDALRKVAEMYQNVEKGFSRKSQEKAQLERQIAELSATQPVSNMTDPMIRLQNLERQLQADRQVQATKEWKAAKNLSPEAEAKMVDYLAQPVEVNGIIQKDNTGRVLTKYWLVEQGVLSLDEVYNTVGGDGFKADAIKQELKNAVANEYAAKQTAKQPSSLSTNSTQFSKPMTEDDAFLAGLLND